MKKKIRRAVVRVKSTTNEVAEVESTSDESKSLSVLSCLLAEECKVSVSFSNQNKLQNKKK